MATGVGAISNIFNSAAIGPYWYTLYKQPEHFRIRMNIRDR